jgi:small subunit ribosomal protein S8
MINDTISDMLTRIRNAQMRSKDSLEMPYSKQVEQIAKVLEAKGFLAGVNSFKYEGKAYKGLHIDLKYTEDGVPAIQAINRVSKPGLRNYAKSKDIKRVLGGLGISVISTSRGIMASDDARRQKLGGEVLCEVY